MLKCLGNLAGIVHDLQQSKRAREDLGMDKTGLTRRERGLDAWTMGWGDQLEAKVWGEGVECAPSKLKGEKERRLLKSRRAPPFWAKSKHILSLPLSRSQK